MKLFGTIYDKTMAWSKHRFAPFWLTFVSFIESIFFPIPPDVMLIPMSMSKPHKALRYALYATIASVVGGMIGYAIGFYSFDWVKDLMGILHQQANFDKAMGWFESYGWLVVFVAGFSPIPYKVFTICAGVMQMAFLPFVLAAAVSRCARFVLVAKLSACGGEKYEAKIRHSIEIIGWAFVILAILAYVIYQLVK